MYETNFFNFQFIFTMRPGFIFIPWNTFILQLVFRFVATDCLFSWSKSSSCSATFFNRLGFCAVVWDGATGGFSLSKASIISFRAWSAELTPQFQPVPCVMVIVHIISSSNIDASASQFVFSSSTLHCCHCFVLDINLGVKKNMCVSSDPTDPNFLLRPWSFYCLWGQNAIKWKLSLAQICCLIICRA